jgi:hypothetical protein
MYSASQVHLKNLMLLLEKNHKDDTKYAYWFKWSSARRISRYFEEARTVLLAYKESKRRLKMTLISAEVVFGSLSATTVRMVRYLCSLLHFLFPLYLR